MIKGERDAGPQEFCHILFDLPSVSSQGDSGTVTFLQVNSLKEVPPGAINIRPVKEGQTVFIITDVRRRVFHSHVPSWEGQPEFYNSQSGKIRYSFLGYGDATRGEVLLHKVKSLFRRK